MIKINLLPPELRKRSANFDLMKLVGAAELVLCTVLLAFGAYLQWVKIPAFNNTLANITDTAQKKADTAAEVAAEDAKISDFTARRDKLKELLDHKVYWAHTLDDFETLLASNFPQNSHLRCLDVTIEPTASAGRHREGAESNTMQFLLRGRFQLIGDINVNTGEYINSMFRQIAASSFWREHGFQGKPEDTYNGDIPVQNKDINKVVVPMSLDFTRVHVVPSPKPPPEEGG